MPKIHFTTLPKSSKSTDELQKSLKTSANGMHLNKFLLRLTSENIAHADTLSSQPGGDAYRAKLPVLGHRTDSDTGAHVVFVRKIVEDKSHQDSEHIPEHPGADANGMVKKTNVSELVEKVHLSKYQKSANANLQAYQVALKMRRREIDELLK